MTYKIVDEDGLPPPDRKTYDNRAKRIHELESALSKMITAWSQGGWRLAQSDQYSKMEGVYEEALSVLMGRGNEQSR